MINPNSCTKNLFSYKVPVPFKHNTNALSSPLDESHLISSKVGTRVRLGGVSGGRSPLSRIIDKETDK